MEQLRQDITEALTLDRPVEVKNVLKTTLCMIEGKASVEQVRAWLQAVMSTNETTNRDVYLAAEELYIATF